MKGIGFKRTHLRSTMRFRGIDQRKALDRSQKIYFFKKLPRLGGVDQNFGVGGMGDCR